MTEQLLDPQQTAFWASDPSILPNPDPIPQPAAGMPEHRKRLALEIAAAFLVCSKLVRLALAAQGAQNDPGAAAARAWDSVMPVFTGLTEEALSHSLQLDPAMSTLDMAALGTLAQTYARGLGAYLGSSSVNAFLKAFDRQQSERWTAGVAWARAAAGFGMDERAYGPYLRKATAVVDDVLVTPAAQAIADGALLARATLIGESEAHSSTEAAKTLLWMDMLGDGLLSPTSRRKWKTHTLEDKCPVCGPLNNALAPIDEPFIIDGRELWHPLAHPNCRCHLELVDELGKAEHYNPQQKRQPKGTPHGGEFAVVADKPRAAADDILEQLSATQAETQTPSIFADPFSVDRSGASTAFAANPFAAPSASAAFAGTQAFAAKTTDAFASRGSDAFAAKGSAAFGRRISPPPTLRIRRSFIIPPPLIPQQNKPYYLPADHFHAQVNEHDMGTLFGLDTSFDMDLVQGPDRTPLVAMADPSPWGSLRYSDLAHARVRGAHFHDDHGNIGWRPQASQEEVASLWDAMLPTMVAGWQVAIAGASGVDNPGDGIAAHLEDEDRDRIAEMAGFTQYSDQKDLTTKIQAAAEDLGDGNDSLAAAYADYVVYQRPDLLGTTGDEIINYLGVARDAGIDLQVRPADQVLNFQSGFHPGTEVDHWTAEPHGVFIVNKLGYHSAIQDKGLGARPLQIGLQVANVQPHMIRKHGFL